MKRSHHCFVAGGFGGALVDAEGTAVGGDRGTLATLTGVLETLPIEDSLDPLDEVGTSSASTGLGRIAALPGIGSAIL